MNAEQAERAILRWCRVRGHLGVESCDVPHWHNHGPLVRACVGVSQTPPPNLLTFSGAWTVCVRAMGLHGTTTDLTIIVRACGVSYSEAWLLGADLARALERRSADGGHR